MAEPVCEGAPASNRTTHINGGGNSLHGRHGLHSCVTYCVCPMALGVQMSANPSRRKVVPSHAKAMSRIHDRLLSLGSAANKRAVISDKTLAAVFAEVSDEGALVRVADELQAIARLYGRAADVVARRCQPKSKVTALREKASQSPHLSGPEQLDQMHLEALAARRALVEAGEVVGSEKFAELLGVTRQALSKAVGANRMFFIQVDGRRYYPRFFADPGLDRNKLEECCRALQDLPGGEKWVFFTLPKGSLGGATPLDALRQGKYAQVLTAARGFAQR